MADKEYIERESVLKLLADLECRGGDERERDIGNWLLHELVPEHISNIPAADVVEVVRCKDCGYCDKSCGYGLQCRHPNGLNSFVCETDFCSMGAKMDGKGEGE